MVKNRIIPAFALAGLIGIAACEPRDDVRVDQTQEVPPPAQTVEPLPPAQDPMMEPMPEDTLLYPEDTLPQDPATPGTPGDPYGTPRTP